MRRVQIRFKETYPMSEQTQSDVIVESSPQVEAETHKTVDDISSLELPNLQQNNEVM